MLPSLQMAKNYILQATVKADRGILIFMYRKKMLTENGDLQKIWDPVINTPFNEDTPFITENDSVLYFSSEGHNSIGGFDNYKTRVLNSGFQTPVNLGFPINTTDDDNFYQPASNGLNAFYSMTTDYKKKDIFYLGFGDIYLDLKGTISLSDTSLVFDENYTFYVTDKTTGDTLKMIHPDAYTGFYNSKN